METNNGTPTLFDVAPQPPKKKGNPNHNRRGRFTNKTIARAERAEKRAEVAEHKLEYISSCYHSLGRQFAELSRQYIALKTKLSK